MDNELRELSIHYKGKVYTLSVRLRLDSNNLIVFLHGWGGAKECFLGAFSSDVLKEYSICAIDLLGFGKSEKPKGFSYDLLDQAHVVAAAINSLGAEKIYLVGHSMGGSISLLAAPLLNKKPAMLISAESNLAPNGSGMDVRAVSKQPFWLFKAFTLPFLKFLLCLHPKRSMRAWAKWYSDASPLALYKSIQSLARWSDGRQLLPLFESLPHKAYVYGADGKRRMDVVPKLNKSITHEIPASGHRLMDDNPGDFYATVAAIIQVA